MLRSRLAPTPSGYIHFGNLLNFTKTWLITRALGGSLHLRIDDLDFLRYRPKYVIDILEVLQWIGITYDTGPKTIEEFEKVFSQRLRMKRYLDTIKLLRSKDLLYSCECSRKKIEAGSHNSLIYPGWCKTKKLPFTEKNAWRIEIPPAFHIPIPDLLSLEISNVPLSETMGDFIIRTKNGSPSYQIASLLDDMELGINLIIRGNDLIPSTAAQLYLSKMLDFSFHRNVQFHHHPLMLDQTGNKLSKTAGNSAWKGLSHSGLSSREVISQLFKAMGMEDPGVDKLYKITHPQDYLPTLPFR
jgi:glutamyl-tRNA synthetase